MKAVIYARFSTDKQREASIEDQVRICRSRAAFERLEVTAVYSDEGVSGTTTVTGRDGSGQLMAAARNKAFDVLIIEGLDRLARDSVEQETTVRLFEFWGLRIIGVSDGYDSLSAGKKLHRGMRGLINEIYIDDLRHKTHRGLAGQVARGFVAGAAAYGYRLIKDDNGSRLAVNPEQAEVVAWIFERFAAGWSYQRIVNDLNIREVPSPRGTQWTKSSLAHGILHNELYLGRYIWNRSQWVKSPETGKRMRIARPQSEWVVVDRQDLRIISDDLWDRAGARKGLPEQFGGKSNAGRPQKTLLSGTLRCGLCGSPMIAYGGYSYGCSTKHRNGVSACSGITVPRKLAETRMLSSIRDFLSSKESARQVVKDYEAYAKAQKKNAGNDSAQNSKRLEELTAEIDRVVDAIAAVGVSDALRDRLKRAEAEREALRIGMKHEAELVTAIPTTAQVVTAFRALLLDLSDALSQDVEEARVILRDLLGEVRITREGKELYAEIDSAGAALAASGTTIKMVAGAGFEPTTFGL